MWGPPSACSGSLDIALAFQHQFTDYVTGTGLRVRSEHAMGRVLAAGAHYTLQDGVAETGRTDHLANLSRRVPGVTGSSSDPPTINAT